MKKKFVLKIKLLNSALTHTITECVLIAYIGNIVTYKREKLVVKNAINKVRSALVFGNIF